MRDSTTGAQAASSRPGDRVGAPVPGLGRLRSRRLTGFVLGATLLAGLAAAPTAAAATSVVRTLDSVVALTTTTIDKPYYTVERFYLNLVNCTRTGGWVLSDGTCRGYGSGYYSGYVAPLAYSFSLSDKVARPYAKLLAVRGLCSHYVTGDPGDRLRRAGYTKWAWGENVGCRDNYPSAKAAVLASHLVFQAERSSNGGHWKNIKATKFHWLGVGIWKYGSRTRLVTDFYG